LAGAGRLQSELFLELVGDAAEGFLVPSLPLQASAGREDAAAGPGEWDEAANLDLPGRLAHDAVLLLRRWQAIDGEDGASLRALPPLAGLTGWLQFDDDGRRRATLELRVLRGRVWERVERVVSD